MAAASVIPSGVWEGGCGGRGAAVDEGWSYL